MYRVLSISIESAQMTPTITVLRRRKRDQFGKLIYCCLGRRKHSRKREKEDLNRLSPNVLTGESVERRSFERKSRSIDSLPPILLVPSGSEEWMSLSTQFPKTENGAVILHQGHGSNKLKQFSFDGETRSTTHDEAAFMATSAREEVRKHRTDSSGFVINALDTPNGDALPVTPTDLPIPQSEEQDEDLRGWYKSPITSVQADVTGNTSPLESGKPNKTERSFDSGTSSSFDIEGVESENINNEFSIELPLMKCPRGSERLSGPPEPSLAEMRRRATVTGSV